MSETRDQEVDPPTISELKAAIIIIWYEWDSDSKCWKLPPKGHRIKFNPHDFEKITVDDDRYHISLDIKGKQDKQIIVIMLKRGSTKELSFRMINNTSHYPLNLPDLKNSIKGPFYLKVLAPHEPALLDFELEPEPACASPAEYHTSWHVGC